MRANTIISVEDSDTDFWALQHALQVAGVTNPIERCESGRIAVGCLLSDRSASLAERASLIMLDLNLPGLDGRELLRKLRARDPQRAVPIIVLSTSSHPKDIDACYRAGADAYMVKPLELEDWETKVGVLAQAWLRPGAPAANSSGQAEGLGSEQEGIGVIARIIEGEIIPRLLLIHSGPALRDDLARLAMPEGFVAGEEEVAELTRLLLTQDVSVGAAYVETVLARGATLGSLYLSLLAPAAQLVGDWWRADKCGFAEVTQVLSRLQQLVRDFAPPDGEITKH
jgi:CheY-like chemotaxis protein